MSRFQNSSPLGVRGLTSPEPKASTPTDGNKGSLLLASTPDMRTPDNPPPKRTALTTLPRPLFAEEPETFSTKKERRRQYGDDGGRVGGGAAWPSFKPPPRPPAKSCPPKSRIFRWNELYKAQSVTFLDSPDGKTATGNPFQSKVYDTKKKESYFQQAFIMESEVGAGCFGTVYRVRSREDGRQYAVKIARERYKGFNDRDRKLEEVRKHQFLPSHTNLVKFYTSWEEQGCLYQQFELCTGSLQELAETENNIPERLIWGYLVDLLQAVQHLHNHDLVHMDIKPDNIFFGCDGICKLGDFGLIVDLTNHSQNGWREGDSKYLAPEVLKGVVTKACDVFSLGITILELACDLDLPSKGQLWTDLRTRGPEPSLTMGLSPELRRVIQLMMTQDPERRPTVKQILELPSVAKAVRWREKEIVLLRARLLLIWLLSPLLWLLRQIARVCALPLVASFWRRARHTSDSTPQPAAIVGPWSNEVFSEDEHDCTVSSEGSELAAPLQESSSSEPWTGSPPSESPKARFRGYFDLHSPGRVSPRRNAVTSPGGRARSRFAARTPAGTRSPQKRLFPVDNYLEDSPSSRTAACMMDETLDEDLQVSLQPQSLVDTFDYFSDDDL